MEYTKCRNNAELVEIWQKKQKMQDTQKPLGDSFTESPGGFLSPEAGSSAFLLRMSKPMWRQMPEPDIFVFSGKFISLLVASATATFHNDANGRPNRLMKPSLRRGVVVQIAGGESLPGLSLYREYGEVVPADDVAFVELEFYFAGDILLVDSTKAVQPRGGSVNHFPS